MVKCTVPCGSLPLLAIFLFSLLSICVLPNCRSGKFVTADQYCRDSFILLSGYKCTARKEAKKDIGRINNRDLFMLGLGLYIGEGAKTQSLIRMINANPDVIRLSIGWFKNVCGLSDENFSVAVHLYPDNNIKESLQYWSAVTNLPLRQFGKTQIDRRENKKMAKRGRLPHGTVHLTIKSCGNEKFGVFLSRKIQAWSDEVYSQSNNMRV
ncbi:hypothetical protein ACFLY0_01820 [Patescibacteria group bacterium]